MTLSFTTPRRFYPGALSILLRLRNAKFDGIDYAGSLLKYGHPQHMPGMPKSIRERIGKKPGDTVEVEITPRNRRPDYRRAA